ncbi:MAG: glycerol-3-phosphate 1-O-acyltransferase PlsY [Desulfocucumaceae bacterium]
MVIAIALIASYLIGSIPFGFLLALFKGVDIRQHGSGNIGATNVWRTIGPVPGIIVFALDAAKGYAAVLIGRQLGIDGLELMAGVAALLGHAFPVYLKFKGGKIIATGAGVMFALAPLVLMIAFFLFWVVVLLSRYISLGSIIAALSIPVLLIIFNYSWIYTVFGLFICLFAVLKHIPNIKRLLVGTESRINLKRG